MAPKKTVQSDGPVEPFGAGAVDTKPASKRKAEKSAPAASDSEPKQRRPRRSRSKASDESAAVDERAERPRTEPAPDGQRGGRSESGSRSSAAADGDGAPARKEGEAQGERPESARQAKRRRWQERRRSRRGRRRGGARPEGDGSSAEAPAARQDRGGARQEEKQADRRPGGRSDKHAEPQTVEGMLVIQKGNHGSLRQVKNGYQPSKQDVHVGPNLIQRMALRTGSVIGGTFRRGQGRHKWDLIDVVTVDGADPNSRRNLPTFKSLTSIDPDFHYAVGDLSGETSLKVLDILCPVGRGQRGLIVSPPRSGKTVLMQQFAKAIEVGYPEVHLMILLIDERPEEATEWKRTMERGEVFVSTNDEMAKTHVELAESVWARCKRLVELGEDVVLLMDSITRLGRAYNNVQGDSGRTMSGGLDTRALERPKQFFGAARNTETAGSLTILGTTLIETGSRMDQVIFEEFKGTGNMELVLSRKLAERRIFPAIDIVKTGTRKDEKLHTRIRLKRINTLRRVLMRMHWVEAMELLSTKLDDVEKIDDFLVRFEIDPEA